jgi:hypothetical protein|tara:strand:- start:351 stop:2321 length:1971 start_codon:yes stop_codon:yes gene_type:complete
MPSDVEYGTNIKKEKKEVTYIGRDFPSIRQNLIEFAKTYYPSAYNDFNEASPGMMFIEMASYVGDVLSYYIDNQYREALLHSAEEKKNIFKIAQSFGYKPKLSSPATAKVEFGITVPAEEVNETYRPDLDYAPIIRANSTLLSNSGTQFRLMDDLNFAFSSSLDPRTEVISSVSGDDPTEYTLYKNAMVESGEVRTDTFTFGAAKKFDKIILNEKNVIEITSCIDDDGNKWYQVPFLAQDTVFDDIENNAANSPDVSTNKTSAPFLLKLVKTARRFTTYIRSDGKTEIRFGAGVSTNADEELIPNPDNVGSSLGTGISKLDTSFDPSNFLKTKTYGLAPSNITLNVTYTYGGKIEDNVVSGEITQLGDVNFLINDDGLDVDTLDSTRASLVANNIEPAVGGGGAESPEQVRLNAIAYFNSQNRAVTKEDYVTRVYSLPQKYGAIAKVFIIQDEQLEKNTQTVIREGRIVKQPNVTPIPNPLAMNFYVLGFNATKKLTLLNETVKQNLRIYLSQYRLVTDAINIKDAYIVNIAVRFSIIVKSGFNKPEVLAKCIDKVKQHFIIDKWQINQPIVLSDISFAISLTDGVQSIVPPEDDNPSKQMVVIENRYRSSNGYSGNVYDINTATKDGIVYPSLDPCIFELKFPASDIQGRVVGDS